MDAQARDLCFHWLRLQPVDVWLLSDVHGDDALHSDWGVEWGEGSLWCSGRSRASGGAAVLWRSALGIELVEAVATAFYGGHQVGGGLAGGLFRFRGKSFVLLAVYLPVLSEAAGRRAALEHYDACLSRWLGADGCGSAGSTSGSSGSSNCDSSGGSSGGTSGSGGNADGTGRAAAPGSSNGSGCCPAVVTGGDFNVAAGHASLLRGHSARGLRDSWGLVHMGPRPCTWRRRLSAPGGSVLDHIFVSADLAGDVTHALLLPPPRSDHDAVVCCVRLPHERTYGPGLWRADAGLLADAGVAAALAATWATAKAACPVQLAPSPAPEPRAGLFRAPAARDLAQRYQLWWESFKQAAAAVLRGAGRARAQERRQAAGLLAAEYTATMLAEARGIGFRSAASTSSAAGLPSRLAADIRAAAVALTEQDSSLSQARLDSSLNKAPGVVPPHVLRQFRAQRRHFLPCAPGRAGARALQAAYCGYWGTIFGDTTAGGAAARSSRSQRRARAAASTQQQAAQAAVLAAVRQRLRRRPVAAAGPPGHLREPDLLLALTQLPATAPGPDGLPSAFLRHMTEADPSFARHLLVLFRAGLAVGTLHRSASEAAVLLLPKKPDAAEPQHFRPIALLNADYKLFAKALSQRLSAWLPAAIDADQTGFIPGRDIATNVCLLRDSASLLAARAAAGGLAGTAALLFLDFRQAYDSIDRSFLWGAMRARGLPPSFIDAVRLLYAAPVSRLLLNGWLSPPLRQQRGLRQGDPLSPALFVVVIEALFDLLREDPSFQGVQLPVGAPPSAPALVSAVAAGGEAQRSGSRPPAAPPPAFKVSAFADDATLALSAGDLPPVLRCLALFAAASGLQVNADKSRLWVFSPSVPPTGAEEGAVRAAEAAAASPAPACPFAASPFPRLSPAGEGSAIKVLGVPMGPGASDAACWQLLVERVASRIQFWRRVPLSLQGRAAVANSLVTSTLSYVGTVVALPPETATILDTLVLSYVQRGAGVYDSSSRGLSAGARATTGLFRRSDLLSPRHLGGLGLRLPSLWAQAGQQRLLLLLAGAWDAAARSGEHLPAWTRSVTQAVESAAHPWGDRRTVLFQPDLSRQLAGSPAAAALAGPNWALWRQAWGGWFELPLSPLREDKAAWLATPLWCSPAARAPSGGFQRHFSRRAATAGLRTVGDLISRRDGGVMSAESLQRRLEAPTSVAECNRFLTMLYAGDFVQPRALRALGCAARSPRLTRRGSALPSAPGCSLGPFGTPLVALGVPLRTQELPGSAVSLAVDLLLYFASAPVSLAADGATCKLGAALVAPPAGGLPASLAGPPAGAPPAAAQGLGVALWGMHGRLAVREDLERVSGQGSSTATLLPQLLFLNTVVRRLHYLLRRRPFRLSVVVGEPRLSRLLLPHGSGSGGGCLPRASSLVDAWLELRDALSAFPQWHVMEFPAPTLAGLLDGALPAWRDPLTAFAPPAFRTVPATAALDSAASADALGVALAGRWPPATALPSGADFPPPAPQAGAASPDAAALAGALVSLGPFCGVLAAGCHRRVAGCPGFLFAVSAAPASLPSVTCFCCLWPPLVPSAEAPVVLRPPLLLLRSPDAGLLSLLGCSKGRAPSGPRRGCPAGTGLGCGRISAVYSHRLLAPAVSQALGVAAASLLEPWRSRILRAWPVPAPAPLAAALPVAGGLSGSPAGASPAVSRSALAAAARRPMPWLHSGLLWRRPGLAAFADLTWRLLFGKLAVLQRLHWLSASQRTCPICVSPLHGVPALAAPLEDEAHAFAACGQAQAIWAAVAAIWGTFPGLPPFPFTDLGALVFGAWPGASALPPGPLRLLWSEVATPLLDIGRHLVWLFRGEALAAARPWRPSSGPPVRWHLSLHRIRAAVLSSVSRHVRARFVALPGPAFLATWGLSPLVELAGPGPPQAGLPPSAGGNTLAPSLAGRRLPRLHCPAPWPVVSLLPFDGGGRVSGGGGGGSGGTSSGSGGTRTGSGSSGGSVGGSGGSRASE